MTMSSREARLHMSESLSHFASTLSERSLGNRFPVILPFGQRARKSPDLTYRKAVCRPREGETDV